MTSNGENLNSSGNENDQNVQNAFQFNVMQMLQNLNTKIDCLEQENLALKNSLKIKEDPNSKVNEQKRNSDMAEQYVKKGDDKLKEGYSNEKALQYYLAALDFEKSGLNNEKVCIQILVSIAERYECNRNYAKAIEFYDQVIELDPTAEWYYKRGNAYINNGKYEMGLKDMEQALELDPNHMNAKKVKFTWSECVKVARERKEQLEKERLKKEENERLKKEKKAQKKNKAKN